MLLINTKQITIKRMNQQNIQKNIILYYYIFMIVAAGVVCILSLFLQIKWLAYYVAMFILLHIQWCIMIFKKPYLNKSFTPFYYVFMTIFAFPAAIVLWKIQIYTIILLYILLPLLVMFHYHLSKHTIFAACHSIFFVVMIFVFSGSIELKNQHIVHLANIIIAFIATIFVVLFVYAYNKKVGIENTEYLNGQLEKNTKKADNPKLNELYNNVIAYFEKKQPYRKSNYRLSILADELNTNTKYLSDAINANYGGTFESLLNKYRIDFAKKMLDERLADKYTMEYIYTSAGYSSRSTFYENFRKTFQMTPLEYQNKNA